MDHPAVQQGAKTYPISAVTTPDGVRLHVKDWGRGRPVVMAHGWPLSADSFDDLSLALAEAGFRAISYDRRGFGRSDQPWDGYDYDTLADDLAAVVEATASQEVTLLGFSMGGGEVARYMTRHAGRRVTQAILVASVVPFMLQTPNHPQGVPAAVFDTMAQAITADRALFWTGFFQEFFGHGGVGNPVSPEVMAWAAAVAMQAGLQPTLACARAFASTDFRADLASFCVPTLVIHGTADKTVPIDAAGRAAALGIAGAQLIEYAGAPHGLFASDKVRLIADVLDFVRG